MIGNFQELNRSDDVEIPEIGEKMEQGDLPSVPTMDGFKSRLEEIFKAEPQDSASIKEEIWGMDPLVENKPQSVTLEDGTVVTLPDTRGTENMTKTDDNGAIYLEDGELAPNTTYELNGNIYTTDEQGRIVRCESKDS